MPLLLEFDSPHSGYLRLRKYSDSRFTLEHIDNDLRSTTYHFNTEKEAVNAYDKILSGEIL